MSLLATFAFAAALAAVPCSPPLPQNPQGNLILPGVLGDIAYNHLQKLDAYAPPGSPRPAAVIIHGSSGGKSTHVDQLFTLLDRAGYAWFSVNYASAGDIRAALDYIRCPGRFNITQRLILIGEDTGAQVALEVASQISVDGVVAFGARLKPGYKASLPRGARLLMIEGAADDEVPPAQVEQFCRETPGCVYFPVAGAIHNFENWHPDQWYWKEQLTWWLRNDRRGLWKDIAYSRPGGRDLLLDAYVPQGTGRFPGVIIVHGGGWEAGDKVTYVSPVFEPLARSRFAWFSINYRLTPYVHVPEQLEDVRNAVRFVRTHADWFHVDPHRLALLGESASGHLVAQVASMPCDGCEVQAVVSFYGVYNFTRWTDNAEFSGMLKRLFANPDDATLREYSPFFHAGPNLPPLLLIQGTGDELYEGTVEYSKELQEVHARSDLILLNGAPHGMENWEGHPEWMFYKQRMVDWLRKVLSPK